MKNIGLLQQLANRPLFMQQGHAASVIVSIMAEEDRDFAAERQPRTYAKWYRHPEHPHVGVLPIKDVLYHGDDNYWYGQSYSSIKANLQDMDADESITAIANPTDCYGGTAAGCGSTEKFITENISKPIYSLVDEAMYSAAMYIASPSASIYTLPSAGNGSIGTIIQHMEFSEMLKKEGINFTAIRSGDRKARGGRMEKLDKETEAEMQADVDMLADQFMQAVSDHRGISVDEIKSFEGGTFTGQQSVDKGLADQLVNTPEDFYNAVAASAQRPITKTIHLPNQQEHSMPSGNNTAPAPAGNEGANTLTDAQLEKIKADAAADATAKLLAEQKKERDDEAAEQKRKDDEATARRNAIENSEHAKARPLATAKYFDEKSVYFTFTVEQAVAALQDLPVESTNTRSFAASAAEQTPGIDASVSESGGFEQPTDTKMNMDAMYHIAQEYASQNDVSDEEAIAYATDQLSQAAGESL